MTNWYNLVFLHRTASLENPSNTKLIKKLRESEFFYDTANNLYVTVLSINLNEKMASVIISHCQPAKPYVIETLNNIAVQNINKYCMATKYNIRVQNMITNYCSNITILIIPDNFPGEIYF